MPKFDPHLLFVFDCVGCHHFYGENNTTKDGKLYCPNCFTEIDQDSPYVERVRTTNTLTPFVPEESY